MYDVARLFRDEVRGLIERLNIEPSYWWGEVIDLFLPEITRAAQLQVRLGLGAIALVVRSEVDSVRTRCYNLLGEHGLDFAVATGCERISELFPDAGWLLKIGLTGREPHSKLFCDRRLSLTELERVLDVLDLPASAIEGASALLHATGREAFRFFSVAPGSPVLLELYSARNPEPGHAPATLSELRDLVGFTDDPRAADLVQMHPALARHGRQRYSVELDGAGLRQGLKVEYSDTPVPSLSQLTEALSPSPALARRRLDITARHLGMAVADHVAVRLRADEATQLSVYFNRLYAAVA